MTQYRNPPTIVTAFLMSSRGFPMVRRKLADGFGKLALVGGYQVEGETWQEAVAREVREETGIVLDRPDILMVRDFVTVENGTKNLLLSVYPIRVTLDPDAEHDDEGEPVEVQAVPTREDVAFDVHYEWMKKYIAMYRHWVEDQR